MRSDGRAHVGPYEGERNLTVGFPYRHTCAKCGARRIDAQIGLEATPEEFVATMVDVFRLVREVLSDDGTLWLNYGDVYQDKQLLGLPWRVAFALQADGWYLRSDIIWAKSNPMPESCEDRPTKSHEYLFLLTKGPRYFYDAEAVREPQSESALKKYNNGNWERQGRTSKGLDVGVKEFPSRKTVLENGRNRRTVWTIATSPFKKAHFATFPPKLVEPCILAGTSERGHCPECGARWVRVVDASYEVPATRRSDPKIDRTRYADRDKTGVGYRPEKVLSKVTNTTGWQPGCECGRKPVPDVVLDPFLGSGTVAEVAQHLGRGWIGIDLSADYTLMQQRRTAQTALVLAS